MKPSFKIMTLIGIGLLGLSVDAARPAGSSSPGRAASPSSSSLKPVDFCSPDYKENPTEKQIAESYLKLQSAFKDYDEIHSMVKESLDLFHSSLKEADSHTKIKRLLRIHEIRVCTMQSMILNILESSQDISPEN